MQQSDCVNQSSDKSLGDIKTKVWWHSHACPQKLKGILFLGPLLLLCMLSWMHLKSYYCGSLSKVHHLHSWALISTFLLLVTQFRSGNKTEIHLQILNLSLTCNEQIVFLVAFSFLAVLNRALAIFTTLVYKLFCHHSAVMLLNKAYIKYCHFIILADQ